MIKLQRENRRSGQENGKNESARHGRVKRKKYLRIDRRSAGGCSFSDWECR
jgi:hypothetical protein